MRARYNLVLHRLVRAVRPENKHIFVEQAISSDAVRPDLVVVDRTTKDTVVIDMTLPYEADRDAFEKARRRKSRNIPPSLVGCPHNKNIEIQSSTHSWLAPSVRGPLRILPSSDRLGCRNPMQNCSLTFAALMQLKDHTPSGTVTRQHNQFSFLPLKISAFRVHSTQPNTELTRSTCSWLALLVPGPRRTLPFLFSSIVRRFCSSRYRTSLGTIISKQSFSFFPLQY